MMMMDMIDMISNTSTMEMVRVMWMELAIASFAAVVYCTLTGYVTPLPKKRSKMCELPGSPGKASKNSVQSIQEPTACQVISTALRQGRLSEGIALTQELPELSSGVVPANIAPRLLMAAAKAPDFEAATVELKVFIGKFEARALEAVVVEALKNKDMKACCQLQALSSLMSIPKSNGALAAFAKAHASDLVALRALVEEAEAPLAKPFAKAVLEACIAMKDVDLAAEVFEKVTDSDAATLRNVVEKESANASNPTCAQAREIRACGKNGDLKGAVAVFERQSVDGMTTLMYNSILEACVECGNLGKAVDFFNLAKGSDLADVVSYNTIMKGYLASDQETQATALLAELTTMGLVATHASYHGLLNARVTARDFGAAWKLVQEMQAARVSPNSVTCAIMLKGKLASPRDLSKVIGLINAMDQPMDAVLFAAIVEACVRTGQMDVLSAQMKSCSFESADMTLNAPTYGAMIKAFGQIHNMQQVWKLWGNMESRKVQPTAITVGCMVEALVANQCTADAWTLVQQMRNQEATKSLVNTVIYTTILKGFARVKDTAKVMALYEEMQVCGCSPNTITYNTILNAFAHGGAMHRVPALLEDMKAATPPAEPDIVTYSTIVKGFCNAGNLDRALQILEDMQTEGKYVPDEVMYNSLLDGCTREQRPDDALKLLANMKKTGVTPSNYTLSMLAKLMGRCRRLNQAFTLIEDISREYGLKVNIQVYTCLIQACFMNRQANKAVAVHDQMIQEGLRPDEMTYSVLVKGCLQARIVDKAVQLAKVAYGVSNASSSGSCPGLSDKCLEELCSSLGPAGKALRVELTTPVARGVTKGDGKSRSNSGGALPPWRQPASA